jgi:hypothetical protein
MENRGIIAQMKKGKFASYIVRKLERDGVQRRKAVFL